MANDDLISRQAAIATAISGRVRTLPTAEDGEDWIRVNEVRDSLLSLPSAQPRKKGKWLEKKVIPVYENGFSLQSCKCSECGRYDTSPYMYYFSEPNFCSYCGARMGGESDDKR